MDTAGVQPGRPTVSVLMSVYNAERFIGRAIQSVLSQDYDAFELLIGDDASSDGSRRIIERYARGRRITAVFCRTHRGAAHVRNELLAKARGRYISICDADDRLMPGNLHVLADHLRCSPRIGVVHGDIRQVHAPTAPALDWGARARRAGRIVATLFPVPPHGGSLIRKSLLARLGGYDTRYRVSHDFDLMMRLAEVARVRHLRGMVSYVWYRIPGSLTLGSRTWISETNAVWRRAQGRWRASSPYLPHVTSRVVHKGPMAIVDSGPWLPRRGPGR